jgi:hypothetical protein
MTECEGALETLAMNLELLTWERDRLAAVATRREAAARAAIERKAEAAAERRASEVLAAVKRRAREDQLLAEASKAGIKP